MNTADVFVFGKLPTHGDFISRGLSATERQEWDELTTRALDGAREALGDGFEARHDIAPAWRFEFGPGHLCAEGCAGVLAPSVDRAGRRFVIVLGARLAVGGLPPVAAEQVAAALEDALYDVFQSGGDVDALVVRGVRALQAAGVEARGAADAPPRGAVGRIWTGEPVQEIVTARLTPTDLVRALTGRED